MESVGGKGEAAAKAIAADTSWVALCAAMWSLPHPNDVKRIVSGRPKIGLSGEIILSIFTAIPLLNTLLPILWRRLPINFDRGAVNCRNMRRRLEIKEVLAFIICQVVTCRAAQFFGERCGFYCFTNLQRGD